MIGHVIVCLTIPTGESMQSLLRKGFPVFKKVFSFPLVVTVTKNTGHRCGLIMTSCNLSISVGTTQTYYLPPP